MLDLPEVVEVAERQAAGLAADIRARLSFVAGDMFVEYLPLTPISSRPSCTTGMTSAACASCYGVDNVLPPMGDTGASGTTLLDMLMMLSLPGKERTKVEWQGPL